MSGPSDRDFVPTEPLLNQLGAAGRTGVTLPPLDVPEAAPLPAELVRDDLPLPELSELEVVRHFTRTSRGNFGIDLGFYPLGSCTMKYNPKVNDQLANGGEFALLHPSQDPSTVQGMLELLHGLQSWLAELSGLPGVTLQPSAGAHGELTGALIIHAYHASHGRQRQVMLIPDSAHGTNPATASMVGYRTATIATGADGNLQLDALREALDEDVAGLMITNPNTLGLFEEHIVEIAAAVHDAGGLVYMDGANLNAMAGIAKPGDLGMDILHFNLHKTFSVPHGGGGPGAGATAVREDLARFLPTPVLVREESGPDGTASYRLDSERPDSIGRVRAFHGNVNNALRGYAYLLSLGRDGLRDMAETAVLNANYLRVKLAASYRLAYERVCKHEVVLSADRQAADGVRATDIAKRLIDYGIHPPTIYFPLTVPEVLMIEPTETESKAVLDEFVAAMEAIAREAAEQSELVRGAPYSTPVGRLDEVAAARRPVLRW